jgi:hypothetical protein
VTLDYERIIHQERELLPELVHSVFFHASTLCSRLFGHTFTIFPPDESNSSGAEMGLPDLNRSFPEANESLPGLK